MVPAVVSSMTAPSNATWIRGHVCEHRAPRAETVSEATGPLAVTEVVATPLRVNCSARPPSAFLSRTFEAPCGSVICSAFTLATSGDAAEAGHGNEAAETASSTNTPSTSL